MALVKTRKFVKHLATKNRRPQKHYQEALREIIEDIQEHVAKGHSVQLTGFGMFYTRTNKGGKARNPRTGEVVEYGSFRQVDFRPGTVLKSAARGRQPEQLKKAQTKRKAKKK